MLNNNIKKFFLVTFVHHIELQNFLNAPRIFIYSADRLSVYSNKYECTINQELKTQSASGQLADAVAYAAGGRSVWQHFSAKNDVMALKF